MLRICDEIYAGQIVIVKLYFLVSGKFQRVTVISLEIDYIAVF